jgi:hypothetical protein
MASLGTLIVDIVASTAGFEAGMGRAGRAARQAGKDITESFSRLGDLVGSMLGPFGEVGEKLASTLENVGQAAGKAMTSFAGLGSSASTFAAVGAGAVAGVVGVGAAMGALALHAAEVGNKIFELHERTGVSSADLSGLMAIARETGGNFESLGVSLGRATINLEKARTETEKGNVLLYQMMGGAKGAAELGLKPLDEQIQVVLHRIFDLNDVGERNRALQELLGKGWQENVSTLKLLAADGFGPAIAKAKEFGTFFDDEHAAQAHALSVEWENLKAKLEGVATTIGSELIPSTAELMAEIENFGPEMESWGKRFKSVWDGAKAIVVGAAGDLSDASVAWDKSGKAAGAATDAHQRWLDAIKKTLADLKTEKTDLAGATGGTDDLTGATKTHISALESAAKASHDFWEKYNAGLEQAKTEFPQVVSYFSALADEIERIQKADLASTFKTFSAMAMGGGGALSVPGKVPGGTSGVGAPPEETAAIPPTALPMDLFAAQTKKMSDELTPGLSKIQAQFKTLFADLAADGAGFAKKLRESIRGAIDDISGQLAKMAFGERTSFGQIFKNMGEQITKNAFQAGIGDLAKRAGIAVGKRGESSQSPLYVQEVKPDDSILGGGSPAGIRGVLGKVFGVGGAGGPAGSSPANPLYTKDASSSGFGGLLGKGSAGSGDGGDGGGGPAALPGTGGDLMSLLTSFGGGMQHGGEVTPGKAYIVGERNPEFFVPKVPGEVHTRLDVPNTPTHQTVLNFHVNGVQDADSFKRSRSQIMGMLQNQMAVAYGRNR